MPIPTYDEFFRPFLALLASDGALHMRDVRARLEAKSGLTPDELAQRLPSGQFTVVENRIGWARTYLFKAELIERVARATYRLTDAGRRMLETHPKEITLAELRRVPALRDWLATSLEEADRSSDSVEAPAAPEQAITSETITRSERVLRTLVEDELRERMAAMTPTRFEWLVEQLVVRLGYGASDSEVRSALSSGSGDTGVDGVIKEDRLGLGQIYLQAKRWQNRVGRPEINLAQDFYEVETLPENDRTRYTISPAARKELLARLLKENHARAAAEAASAPVPASKPAAKSRGKKKSDFDDQGLFA